jgi:arylsulfatase A-like enzyme
MKKPNVILIMTDDQGYGDLSCMGNTDFVTPHIDTLAENGARFTNFYSNSPVCSPSRASLLTGRYPGNAGVRAILAGHRKASGLTPQAPTIASALKKHGYSTGLVGKWHLGANEQSRPLNNGFDYFYGFLAGCIDYYSHIFYWQMAGGRDPQHDLWENNREIYNNGKYFTELVTEKSVEYIREKSKEENPFLLYVGYNAPHYPLHAPQKYMDRFAHLPWDRQVMAAMIAAVDDGVGEITAELKRRGILENTIIYFQSDNGPSRESRNWLDGNEDPYYGSSSGLLKGHKFSLYEGGIRVPGIISYPAAIKKAQVIDEPVAAMDIFPTLCRFAGIDCSEYGLDGLDISDVLAKGAPSPHDMIFWEMDRQTAVRQGKYKLVLNGYLVEDEPDREDVFLSDLSVDPSEKNNLAGELPEITAQLKNAVESWRARLEKNWETRWEHNHTNSTE